MTTPPTRIDVLRRRGLVLASHNAGKIGELRELFQPLGVQVRSAGELTLGEPVEDADTYVGNARIKAIAAATATGLPALGDDSGIGVDALDGAPGILTARWAGEPRDWNRAMQSVQRELELRGAEAIDDRGAEFVCAFVLVAPPSEDGPGWEAEAEARVRGHVVWPPRGEHGNGFEPIFVPEGETRTYAEMLPAERHPTNHRARAFELLLERLREDAPVF